MELVNCSPLGACQACCLHKIVLIMPQDVLPEEGVLQALRMRFVLLAIAFLGSSTPERSESA